MWFWKHVGVHVWFAFVGKAAWGGAAAIGAWACSVFAWCAFASKAAQWSMWTVIVLVGLTVVGVACWAIQFL